MTKFWIVLYYVILYYIIDNNKITIHTMITIIKTIKLTIIIQFCNRKLYEEVIFSKDCEKSS